MSSCRRHRGLTTAPHRLRPPAVWSPCLTVIANRTLLRCLLRCLFALLVRYMLLVRGKPPLPGHSPRLAHAPRTPAPSAGRPDRAPPGPPQGRRPQNRPRPPASAAAARRLVPTGTPRRAGADRPPVGPTTAPAPPTRLCICSPASPPACLRPPGTHRLPPTPAPCACALLRGRPRPTPLSYALASGTQLRAACPASFFCALSNQPVPRRPRACSRARARASQGVRATTRGNRAAPATPPAAGASTATAGRAAIFLRARPASPGFGAPHTRTANFQIDPPGPPHFAAPDGGARCRGRPLPRSASAPQLPAFARGHSCSRGAHAGARARARASAFWPFRVPPAPPAPAAPRGRATAPRTRRPHPAD